MSPNPTPGWQHGYSYNWPGGTKLGPAHRASHHSGVRPIPHCKIALFPTPPPMEFAIAAAVAGVFPDWTLLPEEILVSLMGLLEIADLIRSGAVCTSWYSAYAAFRHLRLPSPRQPPCLLYSCDEFGRDAAALYCPSTGASFRIPFPLRGLSPIGSAHGWLVVADEVSNLHLMNPLTGGRVALPPITTLYDVEAGTSTDEDGNIVYNVHEEPGDASQLAPIPVGEARDCMYDRAFLSCSPSSGGSGGGDKCVVLLMHTPFGELSFARPGDERWTWIPPGDHTGLPPRNCYFGAAYNEKDGLFYVVAANDSIYALDLNGPLPVARRVMAELNHGLNLTGTSSIRHGVSSCKHGGSGRSTNPPRPERRCLMMMKTMTQG
ncbi:hypothetical protein ACP70R_007460 [Stipagrostis hirtigluma subsp. patula]